MWRLIFLLLVLPAVALHLLAVILNIPALWRVNDATINSLHAMWRK